MGAEEGRGGGRIFRRAFSLKKLSRPQRYSQIRRGRCRISGAMRQELATNSFPPPFPFSPLFFPALLSPLTSFRLLDDLCGPLDAFPSPRIPTEDRGAWFVSSDFFLCLQKLDFASHRST